MCYRKKIAWNFEFIPYGPQEVTEVIKRMGHGDKPMWPARVEYGRAEEIFDSPLSH